MIKDSVAAPLKNSNVCLKRTDQDFVMLTDFSVKLVLLI